jgi:hypothetical protein
MLANLARTGDALIRQGARALCLEHDKLHLAPYPESLWKNEFPFWMDRHEN